jgi:predicted O-methyltransferase YrrM
MLSKLVNKLSNLFKREGLSGIFFKSLKFLLFKIRYFILLLLFPKGIKGHDLRKWIPIFTKLPLNKRHIEITLLHSIDEPKLTPISLVDIAFSACRVALNDTKFNLVLNRINVNNNHVNIGIWPGEHYRLLSALVQVTNATNIIEIGTFHGIGSLSLLAGLSEKSGKVTTFDIIPYDKFHDTILLPSDFYNNKLTQIIGDLQDDEFFEKQRALFEDADFIFMDAAKDGYMEKKFLEQFSKCNFKKKVILMIDDIRLWNMLQIWDEINLPKLDISGFGHYTGTGLVELPMNN